MKQQSFSDYEYSCRKKKTKREEFLDIMEEIIPWEEWVEFVRPYYPSGKRGRPVKGMSWLKVLDCKREKGNRMTYQFLVTPEDHPECFGTAA